MSFIEDIKNMEKERDNKEIIVIEEIVDYFNNKFNSKDYENFLKKLIGEKITENKNNLKLKVEFWEYHNGCSATNFACSYYTFKLEHGEYKYKDIKLYDIQEKVGNRLSELLKNKLTDLGLKIVNEERQDHKSRFNYYQNEITISW